MAERPENQSQILVPMLAGIGNAVMCVPLVRRLGRLGAVTVAARTTAMGDVFRRLPEVAGVEVLGSGYREAWRRHRRLAGRLRPDVYVVPFPSNRWHYSVLAAASGARRVVMHDYPVGGLRALRFVPRALRKLSLVRARRGLHDVEQNLALLEALGERDVEPEAPAFQVDEAERARAATILAPLAPGDFIAMQPGCGATPVGREKRWPADKFAELADVLHERGRRVVILEGPDERGVGREVSSRGRSHPPVIELDGPLGTAAALLERARLYVGNDSGLAHVAAAVGTPAVTLFAAADPARVAPWGCEHLVVTPPPVNGRPWSPRLMYPMDHPGPRLRSARGIDWAAHIRLEDVLSAVERAEGEHRGASNDFPGAGAAVLADAAAMSPRSAPIKR